MNDSRFQLLVIDDDDLILQSIRMILPKNWRMDGLNALDESDISQKYDAAIVDMHLSKNLKADGTKVIQTLSQSQPDLEIISMSGDLNRQTMEDGLAAGATRFLAKPLNLEEFHLVLSKIEAFLLLRRMPIHSSNTTQPWIGYGPSSEKLQREIANLKNEKGPILLDGPSGAGKEVVAGLIHNQENQPHRPMIAINVAAIPNNLFESEFFGHVKGAFTGAEQNKIGLLEAAHGGDLFLDEIEALPEIHQAKLLRFLESGEIRKVGARDHIKVETRVIAATNRSLDQMVEEGSFREDLLWRLNGKKIIVPPLKKRKEDISLLVNFFSDQHKPQHQKKWTPDAIDQLKKHDWPGNVRELKRVAEQLIFTSPLPIIREEDVQKILSNHSLLSPSSAPSKNLSRGLATLMADYEAEIIKEGLENSEDVDAAAKLLGVSRSSLYKKIKDHQIEL